MTGYQIDLRGVGRRSGQTAKRAFDKLSNAGPCSECRHAYFRDEDPLYDGDEEWLCTRYVTETDGEPTRCAEQRAWNGLCGSQGVGFEPIEGSS